MDAPKAKIVTVPDFYKKLEEQISKEPEEKIRIFPTADLQKAVKDSLDSGGELIIPEGPAIKYDDDKPRYDLIPPEALDGLARLYGLGAGKYEDRNWEKGLRWSRVFAAMMRHAWKWWRGEEYDQDDGQHHLLSVLWCAMALYTYFVRHSGTDDRPPHVTSPVVYDVAWRVAPEAYNPKALN